MFEPLSGPSGPRVTVSRVLGPSGNTAAGACQRPDIRLSNHSLLKNVDNRTCSNLQKALDKKFNWLRRQDDTLLKHRPAKTLYSCKGKSKPIVFDTHFKTTTFSFSMLLYTPLFTSLQHWAVCTNKGFSFLKDSLNFKGNASALRETLK